MTRLTYPEIGLTRGGPLPDGYRHLRYRRRIGTGPRVFAAAGEAVLTFRMHRATGAGVRASGRRAAPGVRLIVGVGPVTAPCEVVWVAQEEHKIGFGYGTLAGHPARGEEAFVVERDEQDRVWFTVTAFSRPAGPLMRLAGPVAVLFQQLYARRCGQVLRRLGTVSR
ncbi:uncharacterized protein (UPF0548 family) [Actinoplanes octamycinicus]|uniref:Uncharacterized protein (UPF0548 family) n=1 Tax=Actinoplanes octamycinicus TaxID=135948 RepID=A0A7W7H8H3_9ACTN|nr:DUF1990 domain-containing protein [Actinoplanes octamycinicus]MBB4745829.1 uncharacterized protein (UPF0548 family) [Actinoplanes octamycinicus]GIE63631.1 DUF1990 domain-containing protein [Actinoplanes octamycinicus]